MESANEEVRKVSKLNADTTRENSVIADKNWTITGHNRPLIMERDNLCNPLMDQIKENVYQVDKISKWLRATPRKFIDDKHFEELQQQKRELEEETAALRIKRTAIRAHYASLILAKEQIKPMPYKISDKAEQARNRESEATKRLSNRTSKEWLKLLNDIEEPGMRGTIARLVWWDFFSGRNVIDRVKDFDSLIDVPVKEYPLEQIGLKLVAVGYTPWRANERLFGVEFGIEEQQEEMEEKL